MSDWTVIRTWSLGCLVALFVGRRALRSQTPYPLPPGPPGLPLIGNIIGVNADAPWFTYAEWAKKYGDLVYSRLLGKDIIIINSEKVAKDLLEDRSRNYSGRPYFITDEMCGTDFSTLMAIDGDYTGDFSTRHFISTQYPDFCLYNITKHVISSGSCSIPPNSSTITYSMSIILNSTYDYDPASRNDELVGMVASALKVVITAVRPDIAIVVGAFPLLLHLPSWVPGMSFKRRMAMARASSKQYVEQPFEYSLQRMSSGSVAPFMVHDALRRMEEKGISPETSWMEELKGTSATAFLAGSETSHSVLMMFFLMMMMNQAAQEKAQAQIDAVVDTILWETIRYGSTAPLAVPHATADDDVYNGFHIPKGVIVIVNHWSMAHDESRFPNPHAFVPERFIDDDGSFNSHNIEHIAFGFGRRICVGRHFALTSAWAVIAKVLAVFKVLKPLDKNGMEAPVEPGFSSGIVVHPLPFKYRVVPRFPGMYTERMEQLIAASAP